MYKNQSLALFKDKLKSKSLGWVLSSALLLGMGSHEATAQKTRNLGKVKDFQSSLSGPSEDSKGLRTATKGFKLSLLHNNIDAQINVHKQSNGTESFIGNIADSKNSIIYFNISNGVLEGKALFPTEKKAYAYHTNALGEVVVNEEDIHKTLCIEEGSSNKNARVAATSATQAVPPPSSAVYTLQSLPGASTVIHLDFDGEYVNAGGFWNGGLAIDAPAQNFSETNITEIWKLVSEDFRPFNINVTTSTTVFQAAAAHKRTKCIFTSSNFAPGGDGVAKINSFFESVENPCWVFAWDPILAAETASHEIGHTFGLLHDGNSIKEYESGSYGWAPIMGTALHPSLSQWSKGEYFDANNQQDDINIIANTPFVDDAGHVIGFRTDEAGNTLATAKLLSYAANGDINATANVGIIAERTDVDVYYFNSTGGTASIQVTNVSEYANLDIQLTLKNSAGNTLSSVYSSIDPATSLNSSFASVLPAGKYYILIDGVGKGDPLVGGGYTDYASLGQYKITGNIIANTAPRVTLTHSANNGNFSTAQVYRAPAAVRLSAGANDIEGPISKVEFYQGTVKIGEDNAYPVFEAYVNNLPAGTYTFTAKAFDQAGLSTTSAPVTFSVDATAPTITLTGSTPTTLVAPASLSLSTAVNDPEGPIKKVEFYQNNVKIWEDEYYPSFNAIVSNLAAGTYTFTAKVYDQADWVTTSAPLVYVVNSPCVLTEAIPASTQFVLRNVWGDQNAGAAVSNESDALKIVQRAYGQNELWVLENQKLFAVTNGQAYNVKFDFKNAANIGVVGVDVAFATGINGSNNGPTTVGSIVSFPAGYSSSSFTTKSVNLTSTYTGQVFLAIRLRWASQPNAHVINYLKNLNVCPGNGTQSRDEAVDMNALDSESSGMSISPNPSESQFSTIVSKEIEHMQVSDIQGKKAFEANNIAQNTTLNFGESLPNGLYMVHVKYADGSKETFKIVKLK